MSVTDNNQQGFKAIPQEQNKDDISEELQSQCSRGKIEGFQNKNFSCKQFLFGTQKRTALSVCFLVFSLLGVAGFIVGMLIISGDIRIQQNQIVTGIDGRQYNLTNLQVKPQWSLQYNDFIVMQPVLNTSRLLQEEETQSGCFYHHSPDGLVTVQQCGDTQSVIVNDEKVDQLVSGLVENHSQSDDAQNDDNTQVDLNDQFQNDVSIGGKKAQISSQKFVSIDSNGNLISDSNGNRRILRFKIKNVLKKIAKTIVKVINVEINVRLEIAKKAAPYIGAAVGFLAGGTEGMCAGWEIGEGVQKVLQYCYPDPQKYDDQPKFKCSSEVYKENKPSYIETQFQDVSGKIVCSEVE